jgi:phosphoribosyl 1,2-cyclic phosphate phosphodiesterase
MRRKTVTSKRLTATLLGTGTSTGVPVIGCECRVCRSEDPRDNRMRCSAYISVDTDSEPVHILIDAGPDFRIQALREDIRCVDAVLITHHHFDHVVGLDDLRPYFFDNRKPIPVFTLPDTARVLRSMFSYIFEDGTYPGISKLVLKEIGGPFEVVSRYDGQARVSVTPIPATHANLPVLGYRIGDFAYLTDVSDVPSESRLLLKGVKTLVLDALRHETHPAHLTLAEAAEIAREIGAEETRLIHMTHSVMHREVEKELPEGVALGYDGLQMRASVDMP